MMRSEFEQLTGIYPSTRLWVEIEKLYNKFNGDKQAFCKAFKGNKYAMAQIAQERANDLIWAHEIADAKERKAWAEREDELLSDYYKKCEELEAVRKELNELKAGLSAMKALFTKIS